MATIDKTTRSRLDQLDDELDRRITALIEDCPYKVTVNSSWRSSAKQAELYAKYLNGTGNLAARPGTSLHEKTKNGAPASQAVDLNYQGNAKCIAWIHENAKDYGLHFPVRGENWHAQCTTSAPIVDLDPPKPVRPKTNVPEGRDPLLGLQNPRLYGPKVADVQRALIKLDPDTNRAALGEEVDLQVYGSKTAALMNVYKKNRGMEKEKGVTPAVWARLRKDIR